MSTRAKNPAAGPYRNVSVDPPKPEDTESKQMTVLVLASGIYTVATVWSEFGELVWAARDGDPITRIVGVSHWAEIYELEASCEPASEGG